MSMLEAFQNPSMFHAAVVHLPIALSMLGVPGVLLALIFGRVSLLRVLAIACYALLAASAYYAEGTGELAREAVPNTLSQAVWDTLDHHEQLAARAKFAGLATALVLALGFLPQPRARKVFGALALVGSLATAYMVAAAAHEGGMLVYRYGVGTPHMKALAPAPVPAPVMTPAPVAAPAVDAAPAPAEASVDTPAEVAAPAPAEPAPAEGAVALPEAAPNTAVLPAASEAENPDWIAIRPIDLEAARQVVFSRDIWPIIDNECIDCHSAPEPDGDYDMSTRELMLLPGAKAGAGIVAGDPEASAVIQYVRGVLKPRMPHKSPPLSEDQVHLLREWIAAGAVVDAIP